MNLFEILILERFKKKKKKIRFHMCNKKSTRNGKIISCRDPRRRTKTEIERERDRKRGQVPMTRWYIFATSFRIIPHKNIQSEWW